MNTALRYNDTILYLLTALFIATLYFPFSPVVNNVAIALLCSYCLFLYNSFSEKRQLLRQRKAILWMLLFFLLHVGSFFLSSDHEEATTILRIRSPLLLFPLSLGTISVSYQLRKKVYRFFAIITTLAAVVCLVYAIVQYRKTDDVGVLYNDSLTEAIKMQSIYFAMLVNLTIFCFAWLLYQKDTSKRFRTIAWISIVFLLVIHFMLASRIAIIILYTSLLLFSFYNIIKKKRLVESITLVLGLLIGVFMLVKFFPKTINRFRELNYREYNYNSQAPESHYNGILTKEQWNGANIRLAAWSCAWELFKESPLTGWSIGDKQPELERVYRSRNFTFGYTTKRNTHNNYLDVLITFGIIGLIIYLLGYAVLPFAGCILRKDLDITGMFIIAAFTVSLLTENYMDRSLGSVLLAFFISFTIAAKRENDIN